MSASPFLCSGSGQFPKVWKIDSRYQPCDVCGQEVLLWHDGIADKAGHLMNHYVIPTQKEESNAD